MRRKLKIFVTGENAGLDFGCSAILLTHNEARRYYKEALPMTITIDIAPELQAELARQAATRGVGVHAYTASLIERAARLSEGPAPVADSPQLPEPSRDVVEAIETLRGFGKAHRLSLGGLTIRELRHEARP
jgi:hypothetical protein